MGISSIHFFRWGGLRMSHTHHYAALVTSSNGITWVLNPCQYDRGYREPFPFFLPWRFWVLVSTRLTLFIPAHSISTSTNAHIHIELVIRCFAYWAMGQLISASSTDMGYTILA
jgi:hypothetical protein